MRKQFPGAKLEKGVWGEGGKKKYMGAMRKEKENEKKKKPQ